MPEPLLTVKDLTVEFIKNNSATKAVDSISFEINKGQTLGLVGESGSGKSVTSLAIMQLLQTPPAQISSGEVMFDEQNLLKLPEKDMCRIRGNRISMIFQEPMTALNPMMQVGSQIAEVLSLHKRFSKKQAMQRSIELMEQVGIADAKDRLKAYPHELSGGQKQRVMIAMAIACEPDLLIADEPTTALDVTIQKQVLELLQSLQEKYQMAMLFITHDLGVISGIADQVLVMRQSKIVERGSVDTIFKNPQHPYTKGLIACRPQLTGNPKRLLTLEDFVDHEGKAKSKDELTCQPKKSFNKNASQKLIKVKNLSTWFSKKNGFWGFKKSYIKAVDNVSFNVYKGETLGIVGESGSGKTTLGRTLLRLQKAKSGCVNFDGMDVFSLANESLRKLRSRMQIIFQDPYSSLNPKMTVKQILLEPLQLHQPIRNHSEHLEKIEKLLSKVGLNGSHLNRYPHEFSGGQRQRISIARAISIEPDFIICDESVSALDVSVQATVINLLKDLQDEMGLTYIFISHDLSVINCMADRVAVMQKGKVVELNTIDEIYQNPQSQYTQDLLNAVPKVNH